MSAPESATAQGGGLRFEITNKGKTFSSPGYVRLDSQVNIYNQDGQMIDSGEGTYEVGTPEKSEEFLENDVADVMSKDQNMRRLSFLVEHLPRWLWSRLA